MTGAGQSFAYSDSVVTPVRLLLMERNNNRGQAGRPHSAVSPHFV